MSQLLVIVGVFAAFWFFLSQARAKPETEPTTGGYFESLEEYGPEYSPFWYSGGEEITMTLDDLYEKHGRQKGLDPLLLKAIAQVESNEDPSAKNPLDPSVGLMQVLCVPDGRGGCSNRLNVCDWPPGSEADLYDPDFNLHIAAQVLKWNINQFGTLKGIAVYNSWVAHEDPREGPFSNQGYVDKVLSKYRALGGFLSAGVSV